jgi:hypothetical protein
VRRPGGRSSCDTFGLAETAVGAFAGAVDGAALDGAALDGAALDGASEAAVVGAVGAAGVGAPSVASVVEAASPVGTAFVSVGVDCVDVGACATTLDALNDARIATIP